MYRSFISQMALLSRYCFRFLGVLLLSLLASPAHGQSARLLPAEDPAMSYVQRLQHRGHLLDLHPTAQPYTMREVEKALLNLDRGQLSDSEQRWVAFLEDYLALDEQEASRLNGSLTAGIRTSSNRRLDPLRPLNDATIYSHARLDLYLEHQSFIAHFGPAHENYWARDPDGLKAVNRIHSRSDRSYLGYTSSFFDAYLGRFNTHWGPNDEASLIISQNPRTFDRLTLRIGNGDVSFRTIIGELDAITADGRYTGTAGADSVAGSEQRYMAAHRLDWRPSPTFIITITEGVLYSGPNTGLTLKYLNPLHPYVLLVDNRPKNEENNGMIGLQLWGQTGSVTLQGQVMIDDIDLEFKEQPLAFALTSSLHAAGLTPNMDLHLNFEAISARAYNAEQAEGRFQFLNRGLGTQFNDYVYAQARLDVFADGLLPGLTLQPAIQYLAQGRAVINQPNPANEVPSILSGTIEKTLRAGVAATWIISRHGWIRADLGINNIQNRFGRDAIDETLFVGQFEFGVTLPF